VEYAGYIIVEDAQGVRARVEHFRRLKLFKKVNHFELGVGQKVDRLDHDTFVMPQSGQKLRRVK
jgi:hypothetical protein